LVRRSTEARFSSPTQRNGEACKARKINLITKEAKS
jgi:hypothetical protein